MSAPSYTFSPPYPSLSHLIPFSAGIAASRSCSASASLFFPLPSSLLSTTATPPPRWRRKKWSWKGGRRRRWQGPLSLCESSSDGGGSSSDGVAAQWSELALIFLEPASMATCGVPLSMKMAASSSSRWPIYSQQRHHRWIFLGGRVGDWSAGGLTATTMALGDDNHTTRKIICYHEKNRHINTKIVAIDTCCHNFKVVASCGNK